MEKYEVNYFENKTILVPHDFSELSDDAVETAIKIAGKCENVTVLHVVDPTPLYGYADGSGEMGGSFDIGIPSIVQADEIDEDQQQRAIRLLQGQFGDAQHVGLKFATTVNDASHGIADYASENEFDLIVMPSHGRTGVKRLLIGSVTERVVRLAHCPVMVLRT
jgi:nucleotide-binding universal stress UspA family protein